MQIRWSCLLHPHVEHKSSQSFDLVQHAVGDRSDLGIPLNIPRRVQTRPLLLPLRRMFARSLDLGSEKLAFPLEEPRTEPTHLLHRENEPSEAEHGAVIVAGVVAADVGADMPKFVKIRQNMSFVGSRHTKTRTVARAFGRRARPDGPCVSGSSIGIQPYTVNVRHTAHDRGQRRAYRPRRRVAQRQL